MSREVNDFHGSSSALPKGCSAVATPPPGEHDDGDAVLQEPAGLAPCCDVGLGRLRGAREVDRQRDRTDFRHAHEIAVDQDAVRPAELFGEREERNAVADAERMIGDDDERRIRRQHGRPGRRFERDRGADHIEKLAHHSRALAGNVPPPAVVNREQAAPPREVLDGAHRPALPGRVARRGIGQRFGLHVDPVPQPAATGVLARAG
jgi:hypothetical protein